MLLHIPSNSTKTSIVHVGSCGLKVINNCLISLNGLLHAPKTTNILSLTINCVMTKKYSLNFHLVVFMLMIFIPRR